MYKLSTATEQVMSILNKEHALKYVDFNRVLKGRLGIKNLPGVFCFTLKEFDGSLRFSVDCICTGEELWCRHMAKMFELGLERLLLSMYTGSSFSLIMPVYPELEVGLTLDFQDNGATSNNWVTTIRLASNLNLSIYEVGTFSCFSRQHQYVNAIENLFVYIAEVNDSIFTVCGPCKLKIEDASNEVETIILAMTGTCVKDYHKQLSYLRHVPLLGVKTLGTLQPLIPRWDS